MAGVWRVIGGLVLLKVVVRKRDEGQGSMNE